MDMSFEIESNRRTTLATGLCLIALVIAVVCYLFIGRLDQTMTAETDRYLGEITGHVAATINERIHHNFKNLNSISETYQILTEAEQSEYLKIQKNVYGFRELIVLDKNLIGRSESGEALDFSSFDVVKDALNGKAGAAALSSAPLSGGEGLLYVMPRKENDEIIGVIAGWNTKEYMSGILSLDSFGGEGFSQIVNRNGDFIVSAMNKNSPVNPVNYFDLLEKGEVSGENSLNTVKEEIKEGGSGTLTYCLEDGVWKQMNYIPLDEKTGWYLLAVVPTQVTDTQKQPLLNAAIEISIIIVALFFCMIILIVIMDSKNEKKLEKLAFVDPVTDGRNRTRFEMEANRALKEASPNDFMLVSLDIKRFKLINDAFGSEAGDQVLKYVYQTIESHLFDGELVCRISADHFNLLMRTVTPDKMLHKLKKIVKDINQFNHDLERKYYLPVAAGAYIIEDPELSLVHIQDRANIARKNNHEVSSGRLCSCVFYSDVEMLRLVRERDIENRMDQALKDGEFVVFLQPKVDLRTNKISGAEALVRWQDPERGLIQPNDFIPVFEKNGFIITLDLYVFQQACGLLKKWIDSGIQPVPISVNLSRAHLYDPKFLNRYQEIRDEYNVPPELLEIELTETLVFENMEALLKVIDKIHEIGFHCSLDDFGSGYSSLNTLRNVHVDILKLDRGFFNSDSEASDREQNVIESVIELAKKLNMITISEGVETQQQLSFLRKAKCDMVQGYVFSKPLPQEEFERLTFGAAIDDSLNHRSYH